MSRPLTEGERRTFEAIRQADIKEVCLVQTVFNGEETAVICLLELQGEDNVRLFPVAVLVTPAMFDQVTPPDPGVEVIRGEEENDRNS
jgi:hypothetical protein